MRADRLLSILLLLQAHGRLTGRELAKRLEVSERTVHRDMEALSAARVPLYALRGSQGGWQLDEDWRTQVPGLDEAELRAFLMAQPRIIGDPRLAAAAERALGKLMAALPASMREQAASIRQRLFVDTTGWRGTAENLTMLPLVQDAVARDRQLAILYRRPRYEDTELEGSELSALETKLVERTIDPLGLVAKGNAWYLVAHTPRGFRTFRVSRIEKATLLDKPSVRPPNFNLAAYWKSSTEQFRESKSTYYATLLLEPRAAQWVKMWRVASPAETGKDEAEKNRSSEVSCNRHRDTEGWTALRVQFCHENEACFVVLGLGARVDVVEPASLRDRVAADLTAIFARRQLKHSWSG